jgi:hypothetical protein
MDRHFKTLPNLICEEFYDVCLDVVPILATDAHMGGKGG